MTTTNPIPQGFHTLTPTLSRAVLGNPSTPASVKARIAQTGSTT